MTSDLYKSESLSLLIGDNSADIAFYLPNPPMMPDNIKPNDSNFIEQVIELNGNHWRKILTIMAKLAVKSDNADAWRAVRNQLFMPSNELISTKLVINSTQLEQAKASHYMWSASVRGC